MIGLNLLSPEEKLDASLKWNYLIVKNVILMILVVTTAIALVLFSAKLTLRKRLAEAEILLDRVKITQSHANKEIKQTNQLIKELTTAQESFLPWSSVLWQFFGSITQGIKVGQIQMNRNASRLVIEGNAQTREGLLAFRDALNKHAMVRGVDLPLTNLLTKTDIDFVMTIQFQLTEEMRYE